MTSVVDCAASADAYAELRAEFVDALKAHATRVLKTPGDPDDKEDTVAGVVLEQLAEEHEHLEEMLQVIAYAAFTSADPATRLVALSWIDRASRMYGERHAEARLIENAKGGRS